HYLVKTGFPLVHQLGERKIDIYFLQIGHKAILQVKDTDIPQADGIPPTDMNPLNLSFEAGIFRQVGCEVSCGTGLYAWNLQQGRYKQQQEDHHQEKAQRQPQCFRQNLLNFRVLFQQVMVNINILAIESSCDETSASIISNGKILNNIVATQSVHEKYGGVVPELASRAHQQHLVPVVHEALATSGIQKEELSAVAFTRGPGLMGALMVGVSFAKSFAYALDLPLIEVNHMQAHILAHFIEDPKPNFPFLCLTVSGGHTQLVLVKDHLEMEVVGETLDDAVGEAFDKTAKLL